MQLTYAHVTQLVKGFCSTIHGVLDDDVDGVGEGLLRDRADMIEVVLDNWQRFDTVQEFANWALRDSDMDTMVREELSDLIEDLAY